MAPVWGERVGLGLTGSKSPNRMASWGLQNCVPVCICVSACVCITMLVVCVSLYDQQELALSKASLCQATLRASPHVILIQPYGMGAIVPQLTELGTEAQ